MARTLVCIPTYNEASNILALVERVHEAAPEAEILVIDDASPDGTGDLVRGRILKDARLELMARPAKLGLGTAYMAGFAYGLQHGYDRVLTMDSDFSHPPDRIPALIKAIEDGAHLSVGSRYVAGGAIEGWAVNRRILSATANFVARQLLRLRTHDCTGGFRCYSLRALQFLVTRPLRSSGYSALVELLTRCERAGMTIVEVPITFTERVRGRSKISRQEILRAMLTIIRLAGRGS
ncbi:MAG TPA: polyprenol monophosphomannose synthase [Candidatus Dormibacteraeota bacterium]|nr:polyprenol monophosphomannose synthase [Candidatus Dormibacteraeota bacterium]